MERMSSDDDFRKQLEAAPSPEEWRRMVKEGGYDVRADDLKRLNSELSDEDLEKVAGGETIYLDHEPWVWVQ